MTKWENAQSMLESAMDDMELDYFETEGEASLTVQNLISK